MASDFWLHLIAAFWFIIPAYIANASAPLARGKRPIDRRKYLGKARILGDGKTIEGFLLGVSLGTVAGYILSLFYADLNVEFIEYGIILPEMTIFIGFAIK